MANISNQNAYDALLDLIKKSKDKVRSIKVDTGQKDLQNNPIIKTIDLFDGSTNELTLVGKALVDSLAQSITVNKSDINVLKSVTSLAAIATDAAQRDALIPSPTINIAALVKEVGKTTYEYQVYKITSPATTPDWAVEGTGIVLIDINAPLALLPKDPLYNDATQWGGWADINALETAFPIQINIDGQNYDHNKVEGDYAYVGDPASSIRKVMWNGTTWITIWQSQPSNRLVGELIQALNGGLEDGISGFVKLDGRSVSSLSGAQQASYNALRATNPSLPANNIPDINEGDAILATKTASKIGTTTTGENKSHNHISVPANRLSTAQRYQVYGIETLNNRADARLGGTAFDDKADMQGYKTSSEGGTKNLAAGIYAFTYMFLGA